MAFSVIQAGTALQFVAADGSISTLTLPTNVSLRADEAPRFAVFDHYAILVNTPSQPITIDATGTVRLLCPKPPRFAPTIAAANGGTLSGTYAGVVATFVIKDAMGRVIAESDFSAPSNSVTLGSKFLRATNVDTSPDTISLRRLYRPLNNQSVLFPWVDIDGNTITTVQDDTADAALSILAAPVLGSVPDLVLIAEFRGRLFGIPRTDLDTLRYSESGVMYAWPGDNEFQVPRSGEDERGVISLIARRDALGLGKQNRICQFTGSSDADFRVIVLSENVGVESHESMDVYRDTAYFLWKDGVYQWNADGIKCLSDGENGQGNVRSWFATDDYFNRDRFQFAFGKVDPIRNKYRLYLATPDSDFENTWVELDLGDHTWWGPHSTQEFHPTSAFVLTSAAGVKVPIVGSAAGRLYEEQDAFKDGDASPIAFSITGKRHDLDEPDLEKYFGELSVFTHAEDAGTLDVSAAVGDLDATETQTFEHDLTETRGRLGRLGVGKHAELTFSNSELDQDVQIYGYQVDPVNVVGKR